MEVWKDIKGFEGIYQISNKGRLKSFKRVSDGKILSTKNSKGWYLNVVLEYKDKFRSVKLHKLVAEAFIPNLLDKPEINHIDGNKQNNSVENLEWVTRNENVTHAIKHNPDMLLGMMYHNKVLRSKIVQQFSLDGKFIAQYFTSAEASAATGVCQRNIMQVAKKEEYKPGMTRKQAGGFIWIFKEEGGECGAP